MPSRWADTAADAAEDARRKAEKEEKKRLKALKLAQQQKQEAQPDERPAKRQRLSEESKPRAVRAPSWTPTRSASTYEHLNRIEEGSYGFVTRAKDRNTGKIVALKRLKMDALRDAGFPVTALREIQCLKIARHRHVVDLLEVVTEAKDVYLVMEFLEHDLKSLQEEMAQPFTISEVKTIMLQLGSAVDFLHSNWILHRDLKTSNILMNNHGEIKLADFGMARLYSDPPPNNLTQLVVTLWYRAPELLLGATSYDTAIDAWSTGCIFGELLCSKPLLQGKNEVDQLTKIFDLCGMPTRQSWPDVKRLLNAKHIHLQDDNRRPARVKEQFKDLTAAGLDLLTGLLTLSPDSRLSASELLKHAYFVEPPRPKPTAMFPTFPSKAGQEKRRKYSSPPAPLRGQTEHAIDYSAAFKVAA